MSISSEIDPGACDKVLRDPARLAALEASKQFNSLKNQSLDRITRLASQVLNVPLTIVSLIGDQNHCFKSFHGLPEPWASHPVIPIDNSVCRYGLSRDVLSIEDVREHPLLANNPAVPALNLVAYLGVPLIDPNGHNLGAFCAIEYKRRKWSDTDVSVLKDLTSMVMSEMQLQFSLAQVEAAQKVREKAIALVAHDLRSPLAAIQGYADLMEYSLDDQEFCSEALASIKRLTSKSLAVMESYLDQAISAGHDQEIDRTKIDLKKLIIETLADLEIIFGKKFEFECVLSEAEACFDAKNLSRALENLVGNAIKYGDSSKAVTISLEPNCSNEFAIKVHNYGNPLTTEEIVFLLRDGKRTEGARKSTTKGWGLGLEFVKKVLNENLSRLKIESSLQSGTTFAMILPCSPK